MKLTEMTLFRYTHSLALNFDVVVLGFSCLGYGSRVVTK